MNNVDLLFQKINEGREGKNIGLKTGLSKVDKYTGGIQKGIYTLISAPSGGGKTSYVIYSYIYRPLKDYPEKDLKYIYFSLELSATVLLAKLLCLWVYEEYGVIIPYSIAMSWEKPISDDLYFYLEKGKNWLSSISSKLIIYDKFLTAKKFYSTIMTNLEEWGHFNESSDGRRKIYVKNNPEQIVSVICDHVSLVTPEGGNTKKQEIDTMSQYAVSLRERCEVSFYMLQQENRNSVNMDRIKMDLTDTDARDLKDTECTFNDSDRYIAIYYPLKFKLKTKADYPVICEDQGDGFTGLRHILRFIRIVKNRYGESEKSIAVGFWGNAGIFRELPPANEIKDFSLYMHLDTVPSTENKIQNEVEDNTSENDKKEIVYKF